MKSRLLIYPLIFLAIASVAWLYFQVTTYPYKVARWVQPLEASFIYATAKQCSPDSTWLNFFVAHAIKYQGAYSAQVAFIDAKKRLSHCEVGYKNNLLSTKVNVTHRYRYASASKLITYVEIFKLINSKAINLSDSLISFLPELEQFNDERIRQITVAHLLNHRAGFDRETLNGDPMFLSSVKPWCPYNLARLESVKLAYTPGEKQVYSNLGYCLLGEIISRVTGKSYRDLIEQSFNLNKFNIKFINNYYYDDEVGYDYRYEEWYNDSYLKLFDFEAVSAVAGLSGSASSLAQLLWEIHHAPAGSPFMRASLSSQCKLQKKLWCLNDGVFFYRPYVDGLTLFFHEGYLPGVASVAVMDSFGGVTVLVKSGGNRYQENPENEWIRWSYRRLSLYYIMQGQVPILNQMFNLSIE